MVLVDVRVMAVVPVRHLRREMELRLDGFDDVSHRRGHLLCSRCCRSSQSSWARCR